MHGGSTQAANPIRDPMKASVMVDTQRGETYVVVVEPFCDASIVRVVGVIIVTAILVVLRVQRFHAKGPTKELVGNLESAASVLRVEQLRCNNHGNREVTAELVVGPSATRARTVYILVDATAIHDGWIHIVLGIISGVCWADEFSPFN
jgi:hypothetical protein